MTYQLISLDCEATDPVACPHCQQQVIDWSQEQYVQPCEHTLFIAMDIGFEYITDEFEATMQRSVDDLHAHDDQVIMFEELTQASYPKFIMLKAPLGVEGYSRYLGFTA
jgi:hypothetical protein